MEKVVNFLTIRTGLTNTNKLVSFTGAQAYEVPISAPCFTSALRLTLYHHSQTPIGTLIKHPSLFCFVKRTCCLSNYTQKWYNIDCYPN